MHLEAIAVNTLNVVKGALNGGETSDHPEAKKKFIREMAEMLGVAKSTLGYVLIKNKNNTLVSLGTHKGLDIHGKQQWWMIAELFSW